MSDVPNVPRGKAAQDAASAVMVARRRRSIPNGIWGMALFITSEATLFGCLIATYFFLRFRSVQWPPSGIEAPSVAEPLGLTAALLATTIPMVLAAVAAGRGNRWIAWFLVGGSTLIQAGYLAWQITDYISDLDKFSPDGSAYGSIYFTMVGADHAHVLLGIVFNLWVLARLLSGLNDYRVVTVKAVTLYWTVVNVITVLVTLTQVSPS